MKNAIKCVKSSKLVKLFDSTLGREEGGREKGQQSPYRRPPIFQPFALSSGNFVNDDEES
eukprot:1157547-Pelagomonas_calceolata.AAC.2